LGRILSGENPGNESYAQGRAKEAESMRGGNVYLTAKEKEHLLEFLEQHDTEAYCSICEKIYDKLKGGKSIRDERVKDMRRIPSVSAHQCFDDKEVNYGWRNSCPA
jgi:hypothetical protein